MDVFVGIDVAREVHWACAMDRDARVLFSHAVDNDPAVIGGLIAEIEAPRGLRWTCLAARRACSARCSSRPGCRSCTRPG